MIVGEELHFKHLKSQAGVLALEVKTWVKTSYTGVPGFITQTTAPTPASNMDTLEEGDGTNAWVLITSLGDGAEFLAPGFSPSPAVVSICSWSDWDRSFILSPCPSLSS